MLYASQTFSLPQGMKFSKKDRKKMDLNKPGKNLSESSNFYSFLARTKLEITLNLNPQSILKF